MAKDYALHHTGLTVFDIRRSLEFYRDVLGFEVVYEHEKSGGYLADVLGYPDAHLKIALLKLPRSEHRIELLQYISPEGVHADVEPKNVGAVHVAYIVEDIHEIYAHLTSHNVEFISAPVKVLAGPSTGAWAFYFKDPDGIALEAFQPPPAVNG